MKRSRLYVLLAVLLIATPVAVYGVGKWLFWNSYVREVVRQEWSVVLPPGGSVAYRNQSPQMRFMGPADTTKLLIWTKPDGYQQEYPISSIGGDYGDIEFRIRQDGKAVWLVAWDWKEVVATLDLSSGRFTDGSGTVYDKDGRQNDNAQISLPKWAKLKGGLSLGRKKFW